MSRILNAKTKKSEVFLKHFFNIDFIWGKSTFPKIAFLPFVSSININVFHAETKPFRFRIKVQKWREKAISTFFKMLQKCSKYIQVVENRSRTGLWASEHIFLPQTCLEVISGSFSKIEFGTSKSIFWDLASLKAEKTCF